MKELIIFYLLINTFITLWYATDVTKGNDLNPWIVSAITMLFGFPIYIFTKINDKSKEHKSDKILKKEYNHPILTITWKRNGEIKYKKVRKNWIHISSGSIVSDTVKMLLETCLIEIKSKS